MSSHWDASVCNIEAKIPGIGAILNLSRKQIVLSFIPNQSPLTMPFFIRYKLLFLLTLLLPGLIQAQEATTLSADTVTITAGRFRQGAQQTGRNISVMYAEDIAQLPVNSLDELLRYVPGVEVQSRNGFGAQSDIIIRGSTFSQVLMLIDGMRLNDPLTGHFNSNIPISPAEIDRIEILKGPAAAMYGPDAVGGVIHIITKTATAVSGKDKTAVQAEANYGAYDLLQVNAGAFVQRDRLRVGGGLLWNQSKGQQLPTGLNNDFNLLTASASMSLDLGKDWSLFARSGFDTRTFNAQYFYTRSTADLSREQTAHLWNHARLQKRTERTVSQLDVTYKVNRDSFLFNPAFPPANIHTTKRLDAQFNQTWYVRKDLQYNAGIQLDRRSIVSNDRGDHQDWHTGAYVATWWQPAAGLNLSFSGRVDLDENYGLEFLPQTQMSYQLGKTVLRLSAGRSTRAADYTERFISNNLASLSPGRNLGNPDLEAESGWSLESGIDLFPVEGLRVSGTVFARRGVNLIDYVLTNEIEIPNNGNLSAGADYFYTQNLEEVSTRGFEIEVWDTRKWREGQLRTSIGYTYLRTTNADSVVSKYLANHARHLLSGNLILNHRNITLAFNGLWKERAPENAPAIESELSTSYTVWNGRVEYGFLGGRLRTSLLVHNLFNAQYADILGAKMPDRWIMGGLAWRWHQ